MVLKRTMADVIFDFCNGVFMVFMIGITLYPFLYVVFASLSDSSRLMAYNGILWKPLGFNLDAYKEVLNNPKIAIGYRNTIFYVVAGTTINLTLSSLGAYALSRRGFYLKNAVMMFITFTMFFSGGLIPSYLVVKGLGLYDNPLALMLPVAISTWNLIVMRTSFAAIPASMEESAKIDGANDFVILWRIILPLSVPIMAVMVLFYGVSHWNSWFSAAIYLRNRELYPLQLYLREILIYSNTDSMMAGNAAASSDRVALSETIKYATIIVATVPILFVYPFLQKYFVKGIMVGAIKE